MKVRGQSIYICFIRLKDYEVLRIKADKSLS